MSSSLATQSRVRGQRGGVRLERRRGPPPSGRGRSRRPPSSTEGARARAPRRTCGPGRGARHCSLDRRHRRAVGELERGASAGRARPVCIAGTGSGEHELGARPRASSSMRSEDDRRHADLEERGDLGEVGVADDHVEPAVALRVGVRLVAGVDDRPLQRRLEADLLLEEVGPLADLEGGRVGGRRSSQPTLPAPV